MWVGAEGKGGRLGGGGARAPLWRAIQAGVYGYTCDVLVAEEGGAYGAALLAGVGGGQWATVEAACAQAIQVAEQIVPEPAHIARYSSGYQAYPRIYPALRGLEG